MITHIVLFRLKDRSTENIERTREVLEGLEGKVPTLRSLEVGVDVIKKERSFDIALTATFDDLAGLEAYQVHPEHLKVVEFIATVRDSVVAVDYES